jgi:serpin B
MTWTGARGKTRDEMTKVLHLGNDPKAMTASAGKLLASFNDPKKTDYTLSVVNRLFGEKTLAFEPDFLAVTKNDFSAPLSAVDFKHASEPVRLDINAWVEKQTHDKIPEILPPRSLSDLTRLVLVNAIYLHADWANPFAKEATAAQAFHLDGDKTVDVQTMHDDKMLRFAAAEGVKVVDMPYKGSDLSMTFLLPDDASQLAALEQKVEQGGIDALVAKEQQKLVRMALPKFKVASSAAITLSDPLKKLGMPDAFVDGIADFSGMSKAEVLHIAEAYHKAFVAIDEQGTEAAAATAVVMDGEAAIMPAQPQAEFTADHPFLFAIRDTKSGMILFLGRVANPSA